MYICPLLSWCHCGAGGLCPACKVLVIAGVAVVCGVIGYLLGGKKGKK